MTEMTRMTLYPSEEFKERLEAVAKAESRSLNAQCLLMLREAVEERERTKLPPLRSISVFTGDDGKVVHRDMVTGREVDPVTLEPPAESRVELPKIPPARGRTTTCHHNMRLDQHCKVCDG